MQHVQRHADNLSGPRGFSIPTHEPSEGLGFLEARSFGDFTIFFTEIGLIVSFEVVLRLSRKNDGFVTVNLPDSQSISENPFRQSHWTQKYLWTTLPTFIITLYKICWSSILLNSPFVSLLLKCPSRKALQGKEPSFWTIGPTSLLFPGYMNSNIDMLCLDSHSWPPVLRLFSLLLWAIFSPSQLSRKPQLRICQSWHFSMTLQLTLGRILRVFNIVSQRVSTTRAFPTRPQRSIRFHRLCLQMPH